MFLEHGTWGSLVGREQWLFCTHRLGAILPTSSFFGGHIRHQSQGMSFFIMIRCLCASLSHVQQSSRPRYAPHLLTRLPRAAWIPQLFPVREAIPVRVCHAQRLCPPETSGLKGLSKHIQASATLARRAKGGQFSNKHVGDQ